MGNKRFETGDSKGFQVRSTADGEIGKVFKEAGKKQAHEVLDKSRAFCLLALLGKGTGVCSGVNSILDLVIIDDLYKVWRKTAVRQIAESVKEDYNEEDAGM